MAECCELTVFVVYEIFTTGLTKCVHQMANELSNFGLIEALLH